MRAVRNIAAAGVQIKTLVNYENWSRHDSHDLQTRAR